MGPKSGLELAVEVTVLVQESGQRPKIAFWKSAQSSKANGKNGVHGLSVRLLVARELESGLGLAAKMTVRVQENQQRPKIVFWISVQKS